MKYVTSSFIQKGVIKLIKSESEDVYIVASYKISISNKFSSFKLYIHQNKILKNQHI